MLKLKRPTDAERELAVTTALASRTHATPRGRPFITEETIGWGLKRFDRARNALIRFEQFNLRGTVVTPATVASPGRRLVVFARRVGLWTAAPVEVDTVEVEDRRVTYRLRTLEGHPLAGVETFSVTREPNGVVRFRIEATSRASAGWAKPIVPIIRLIQRRYRRRAIDHMRNATGVARSSVAR